MCSVVSRSGAFQGNVDGYDSVENAENALLTNLVRQMLSGTTRVFNEIFPLFAASRFQVLLLSLCSSCGRLVHTQVRVE